ncbi:unnamed protein product, partial [Coregonus sp. 'balchen']
GNGSEGKALGRLRLKLRLIACQFETSAGSGLSEGDCSVLTSHPHSCAARDCNSILHSAADSVTSAVQKASQALNERGERLGRAEEKTGEMKNSAEQFA